MIRRIGTIISGSLTEGLVMRISPETTISQITTGKFVAIGANTANNTHRFFSLVTDIALAVTNSDILLFPPQPEEVMLESMLRKRDIYATATLKPMLMLVKNEKPIAVKTIPSHFSPVYDATPEDIGLVFGREDDPSKQYFSIGSPLDMTTPVCLNLERLTERSSGVFGKTGTGKTFLTRLILAGIVKQQIAVNLVFDMHSEYGLQARKEGKGQSFVKGLKSLFPDQVAIFSLDPASTRRRGGNPDFEIALPYQAIQVEDVLSLQDELNLHPTALEAAYLIAARYKQDWLQALLTHGHNPKEFSEEIGAHPESIAALYRKLKRLERLPFLHPSSTPGTSSDSVIDRMMEYIDRGIHIIVEFGNFTSTFIYLLIANIISRRIHSRYITKTEQFLGSHNTQNEPRRLLITIEEAHKFLNPQTARQTIFSTIAREMRKYYVSLLIVDQRPSCIDPEIISQIGTKIIAQLSDEKDVSSVLTGTHNSNSLRSILASLDSKKQALLLGHALAMPVLIQTREYDETFYRAVGPNVNSVQINEFIKELF